MWQKPWTTKEGLTIGAGLVGIGLLLQYTLGPIDWELFAFPINTVVLILVLLAVGVGYALHTQFYWIRFLMTGSAAVASLGYVALFTLLMGLIPQLAESSSDEELGMKRMLSFWPFVLVYLWMTYIVGLLTIRFLWRLVTGKRYALFTSLSHGGLFLALLCGTLGSADMKRLTLTTKVGQPEWRAQDPKGQVVELPLAIQLHEFRMDEYPMQALLVDNQSGQVVDETADWEIRMVRQLDCAAPMVQDTLQVDYVQWLSVGAASAAYVEAVHQPSGKQVEGWISCGSFAFPYQALKLDEHYSVVMPEREPKRFVSAVSVYTQSGYTINDTILVNRPLSVEGWKIYQLSYDERLGRWSDLSVFELVRDPWLPAVYVGIGLLLIGVIGLFFSHEKQGGATR